MNEVDDFMTLVCEAHIVAAAMTHFKMTDVNDIPSSLAELQSSVPTEEDMLSLVGQLVNQYVTKFVEKGAIHSAVKQVK